MFKDTRNTTEHRTCEKLYNKKKAFKICFWIHDDKSSSVFCSYFFIFLKIVANNFALSKILKCSGNTLRAPNQFWFFSADAMLPAVLNASLSSKVMLICIPADMRLNTVLQKAIPLWKCLQNMQVWSNGGIFFNDLFIFDYYQCIANCSIVLSQIRKYHLTTNPLKMKI